MGRRGKKVSDEERSEVLRLAKRYGVNYLAKHFVLSKSEIYKILRQERKKPLHFTELSITALTLASNFESYLNAPDTDVVIGKIGDVVGGGWLNVIGGKPDAQSVEMYKVDKRIASNLLLHIKPQFPELTEIKDWIELTDDKITKTFVERLRLKANRGEFMGKCPDCPH